MIAGEDKKFVWATARLEGDTVVVTSEEVPHPAAVRYAWSNTFQWANLFNQDGLPAQPFRTDAW
jgi:sialate O-acetylesterase